MLFRLTIIIITEIVGMAKTIAGWLISFVDKCVDGR